jgi:ABC-2 type transport system permease protein
MFKPLLRFEWSYQTRQVSFIIFGLMSFAYGVSISASAMGEGMTLINLNSPYRLNFFIVVTSTLAVLASMVLCINNLKRDKEHHFDGITGCLAVRQQFMSRFVVVFGCGAILVSFLAIGMWLGFFSPELDSDKIASFEASYYLWPWLVFALPNVFICTTLLFAVTLKYQHSLVTYLTGICLFMSFWLASMIIGSPVLGASGMAENSLVNWFALLDPFGTSAFFQQTQFWTAAAKNSQLISFSDNVMLNRLLWLSIAVFILNRLKYLVASTSAKQLAIKPSFNTKAGMKKKTPSHSETPSDINLLESTIASVKTEASSLGYQISSFYSLLKFELSRIINDWPFRIILILKGLICLVGIYMLIIGFGDGEVSGRYPTTALIIGILAETLTPFCLLIIVYYCAEKIWQEKQIKMDSLIDSTPVSNLNIYAAKLLSLMIIPVIMIVIIIVFGMSSQILSGYYRFEFSHYLSLFYFFGLPLFIQTMLIVLVQILLARFKFANKYLGMVVSGFVIIFSANITSFTGIEHPMLQLNQFPNLLRVHTELTGYGLYAIKFHWFVAYWGALSIVIFVLTLRSWNRGEWIAISTRKVKHGRGDQAKLNRSAQLEVKV